MNYSLNHILHLTSLFLLTGSTFAAFSAPVEANRRRYLMFSGILSLIVLVSGFELLAAIKKGFPGWVIVKLFCWLILSSLTGFVFRKPEQVKTAVFAAAAVIVLAVSMVTLKPF